MQVSSEIRKGLEMNQIQTIYYDAVKRNGYYWGRLYRYAHDENAVLQVWLSTTPQQEERHAIDDAVNHAEEAEIDVVDGQ